MHGTIQGFGLLSRSDKLRSFFTILALGAGAVLTIVWLGAIVWFITEALGIL